LHPRPRSGLHPGPRSSAGRLWPVAPFPAPQKEPAPRTPEELEVPKGRGELRDQPPPVRRRRTRPPG
ncbi:hypothetical protein ACFWBX_28255, partial [Streptomyces sp. NPDC059991]